tara:strand:- start:524 stop:631 length:108 start_codon:yes stop_codon:yes gene_type:complete
MNKTNLERKDENQTDVETKIIINPDNSYFIGIGYV